MPFSKHCPFRGQVEFFGQLQDLFGVSSALSIFAFALAIIFSMFGLALYDIFIVCLLKIFESGFCGGKHSSTSFRNSFPIFVFTVELKGGLNQVTSRFLFLFLGAGLG